MRNIDGTLEVRPSLIGTISAIGATAVGAPVDTMGFADVMAVLTAGALQGSAGADVSYAIKFQESATAEGTGALWSDIENGAINGTMSFTTLRFNAVDAGTWIPYQTGKIYERLSDGNRKRFIRAHATVSGTVGYGAKLSVICLLGRPNDTLYINNAASFGSVNGELTKML